MPIQDSAMCRDHGPIPMTVVFKSCTWVHIHSGQRQIADHGLRASSGSLKKSFVKLVSERNNVF